MNIYRTLFVGILFVLSSNASALLPFEKTGNLYVSMWDTDEIAVFTPDGTPLERFTTLGLDGPRGIAFNPANGEIWIAGEFSNAIYIFNHEHQFLRTLEHDDFDEPVGVTFKTVDADASDSLVYISNSNGNEIMVFDQSGVLQRRFTAPGLVDPNCSAFMADGSLMVANRLGGSHGGFGATNKFDNEERFLFDFTTPGITSQMAVARDPNTGNIDEDDTLWVTSGGGDTGIYEFDQNGNLLTTLLPADIDDGRRIIPQGIAFDGDGNFYVVSFLNEVLKFDSLGNFVQRFPTGDGTSRSMAFQGCQIGVDGVCLSPSNISGVEAESALSTDSDLVLASNNSGGGSSDLLLFFLLSSCIVGRISVMKKPEHNRL